MCHLKMIGRIVFCNRWSAKRGDRENGYSSTSYKKLRKYVYSGFYHISMAGFLPYTR